MWPQQQTLSILQCIIVFRHECTHSSTYTETQNRAPALLIPLLLLPPTPQNEKEPVCVLPSCGQMLMHDKHRASAVCLCPVQDPLGDVLQRAAMQTSTGAWSQPHSARCCMRWWGRCMAEGGGGGERSCTISDTVMWATGGTQRMNTASPVSALARCNSNVFKAWQQKIKTKTQRYLSRLRFSTFLILILWNIVSLCL